MTEPGQSTAEVLPDSACHCLLSHPASLLHPDNQSAAPIEKKPEKSGVTPAHENLTQKKSVSEKTAKKNKPKKEMKPDTPERENHYSGGEQKQKKRNPPSAPVSG